MNSKHTLTAETLRLLQVRLEMAGAELRKPHGRIVFDPRNGPTLATTQLAESIVDRVPSYRVVQCGKDDVLRQTLMKRLEVTGNAAPSSQNETLVRCVALEEIVCLGKWSDG